METSTPRGLRSEERETRGKSPGRHAIRLILAVVLLVVVIALLGRFLREPLTSVSEGFVEQFGLLGVFGGTLVTNISPLPLHEPIVLAGYFGGLPFWGVAMSCAAGALLAGWIDWGLGRLLERRWGRVEHWKRRYGIDAFLDTHGAMAVAVAAITPAPFGLVCWAAGAARLRFRDVALGSLLRVPKIVVTLALSGWAWNLSA